MGKTFADILLAISEGELRTGSRSRPNEPTAGAATALSDLAKAKRGTGDEWKERKDGRGRVLRKESDDLSRRRLMVDEDQRGKKPVARWSQGHDHHLLITSSRTPHPTRTHGRTSQSATSVTNR